MAEANSRQMNENAENTRQHLLQAALECFSQNGFAMTSVSEIVARARISRPVMYYYFHDKRDLYLTVLERSFSLFTISSSMIAAPSQSPGEKLLQAARHYFTVLRLHRMETRLVLMDLFGSDRLSLELDPGDRLKLELVKIADIIQEGMDRGEIRPGDPLKIATQLVGIIYMQLYLRLRGGQNLPLCRPEDTVDMFMETVTIHDYRQ